MDGTLGLRERKKRETREALSWAALRLAVERGLDNALVEDIAGEAGVRRGRLIIIFPARRRPLFGGIWSVSGR